MGLRDDGYELTEAIELDEGFFETVDPGRDRDEPIKRGRGSQKQTTVLVMVESKHNPDNRNRHRPDKKVKYLKMKVIENLRSETINQEIEAGVEAGTQVDTDDYSSYKQISETIEHKTPQGGGSQCEQGAPMGAQGHKQCQEAPAGCTPPHRRRFPGKLPQRVLL